MTYLCDLVWSNGALHRDQTVDIVDGKVTALRPRLPFDTGKHLHLLMPGCTDLQVNGGGGVMLNSSPTADGLRQIAKGHRSKGTGWILPTVITDDVTTIGPRGDIEITSTGDVRADAVLYVLPAQILSAQWSADLELPVDDPFQGQNLSRVVSGVTLYPFVG